MKKTFLLFFIFLLGKLCGAQKVDSIYFHLYTDSLKKGFYNYINVDGKTADGRWVPLSATEVSFVTNSPSLRFQSNDLFIDSAYTADTVIVKAVLKANPLVWKEVMIYIRKRGFTEPLKSNSEVIDEYSRPSQKSRRRNG